MKVFNLTDVVTPKLTQMGFGNLVVSVRGTLIAPGNSAELDDADLLVKAELDHLLSLGAVSVGSAPAEYTAAKEALLRLETIAPSPPVASISVPYASEPVRRKGKK